MLDQLLASGGAIMPTDPDRWWLEDDSRAQFMDAYTQVAEVGPVTLWNRRQ